MTHEVLWQELAAATPHGASGYLQRRIRPDLPLDLFIGIERPSNRRLLLLEVAESAVVGVDEPPATRGVELRLNLAAPGGRAALELLLVDPAYEGIFTVLTGDIVSAVSGAATEGDAVTAFVGRLRRWGRFLERGSPEGLGHEAQRGLYGELWFIDHHLFPALDGVAINAWTGPEATAQDFQFPGCAVEVKTTTAKLPQHLAIASERQLDDTGVAALFLVHLSLDSRQDGRRTLPVLIDDLRATLAGRESSAFLLEERLFAAGYLDAHRHRYERTTYAVRTCQIYRVREGFPRLVEADLPVGVGNVRYSVAAAACTPFAVDIDEVLNIIRGGDGK